MKAEVISSGKIVDLVTKRGEYFIDTDSNPYKEEELNFEVPIEDPKTDFPPMFPPMPDFGRILGLGNIQHGVQIAVQYMKDHPTAEADQVGYFVERLMKILKKI